MPDKASGLSVGDARITLLYTLLRPESVARETNRDEVVKRPESSRPINQPLPHNTKLLMGIGRYLRRNLLL